ncbi:MAG: hypothetical protein HND43_01665 [Armatimonadetes bacterium]|nr:hypothetical protein [Armatimonadota bacterium]NOG38091.1 hypothetical protein [Armatimonadota bacterium]
MSRPKSDGRAARADGSAEVRVIRDGVHGGPENMERDRALLLELSRWGVAARVYGWAAPWVSLGRFQNPHRDLKADCCVPWVLRPTGGKAVLHGHDVTVGLAARLDWVESISGSRGLRASYRLLARRLAGALTNCGLAAILAEDRALGTSIGGGAPNIADCFAATSPNDITDPFTGLKVCGCALRLTQDAVLLQASIPSGPPRVDPALVFEGPTTSYFSEWDSERFAEALTGTLAGTL